MVIKIGLGLPGIRHKLNCPINMAFISSVLKKDSRSFLYLYSSTSGHNIGGGSKRGFIYRKVIASCLVGLNVLEVLRSDVHKITGGSRLKII